MAGGLRAVDAGRGHHGGDDAGRARARRDARHTVAERADAEDFGSPALIVVGDIVSMRAELAGAVEAKSA